VSIGSHTGLDRLTGALDEEIAFHKAIGSEYINCPWAMMKTRDDVLALAETLTPVAEKIIASGLKFGYHNHAQEFATDNGEYLMDILFANLPAQTVMELDIFWSAFAGADSLAYMEKNKHRLEILHVKQIDKDNKNVDLDKGVLDFEDIITKAKAMGVKHFILEQEAYAVSSMTSAENGIKYIMSLEG